MTQCWNSIGVRGDRTCPELDRYVHCRNCPVYSAGAIALLDRVPPSDYLEAWTSQLAKAEPAAEHDTQSVVIFRVEAEWLAIPTPLVEEITRPLPIHSLPHRRRDVVLGVANVRGKLAVCVALGRILGIDGPTAMERQVRRADYERFLVVRRDAVRVVCPVHAVHGIHRFHPRDLQDVPATLAKAMTKHSKRLLKWGEQSVGVLDEHSLFSTLKRGLA